MSRFLFGLLALLFCIVAEGQYYLLLRKALEGHDIDYSRF